MERVPPRFLHRPGVYRKLKATGVNSWPGTRGRVVAGKSEINIVPLYFRRTVGVAADLYDNRAVIARAWRSRLAGRRIRSQAGQ